MEQCSHCITFKNKINSITDPYDKIYFCHDLALMHYSSENAKGEYYIETPIPHFWDRIPYLERELFHYRDMYVRSPAYCTHHKEQTEWLEFQFEKTVLEFLYANRDVE